MITIDRRFQTQGRVTVCYNANFPLQKAFLTLDINDPNYQRPIR